MATYKIVIPDDYPPVLAPSQAYRDLIARTPVEYYDSLPGSEQRLIERIASAEVVINIRSSSKFTEDVFKSCPKLRLLSLWGTGTDNVDLPAAARYGVTVTNTPGVSAIAMAEHALALMLAVARNIPRVDANTRLGQWPRGSAAQMHGKTLGIIGLGAIGRQFARLGAGIGMKVLAWTMHPDPAVIAQLPVQMAERDEVIRQSDVVSLHLRLSPETKGFFGKREIGLMKPTAFLINTARGQLVDEAALIEALRSRRIAGAGLDVFETEPLPRGHAITALENVVITPHSGGVTPEALEAGLQLSVDNMWNFLAGRPTNVVAGPAAVTDARGR
ncbi:MAG TPA: phosphoglycerate dehydrogenase [Bryobacterales bacterium]|jgi:phosphoglycerate dehydrogenase-like enzyme|nr:phosphoglycerate dehydrogenase [Bryobacterales bacterium]